MPYTKSLARREFDSQIFLMLTSCRMAGFKKNGLSADVLEMVYQASIFKACAAIEEYLKAIISDWLFSIEKNGHTCKDLPENLKYFILVNSQEEFYRKYFYNKNEIDLIKKAKSNISYDLLKDGSPIPSGALNLTRVAGNRKYPSVKNLKALFSRLGIDEIFNVLSKKKKKDFKLSLESFLDIREAIAHQTSPNLTYTDIKRHLLFLLEFINAVDRTLYSHVVKSSGDTCWKIV